MYSPIILFCYRRLDTLQSCIESLQSCLEAKFSDLIVFSDAAVNDEVKLNVCQVRDYLTQLTGFKSVTLNFRDVNFGVDYNIIRGIQDVSKDYKQFIVVEDDLNVAPSFLRFMNEALLFYEKFDKIITISGFNYVNIPEKYIWDCYFVGRTNPWGWATWSEKIKNVDWELAINDFFLTNKSEQRAFNRLGKDMSPMLIKVIKKEIRTWDIRLDYFLFKHGLITVYSCKNFVINKGFNRNDATNTLGYNRYNVFLNNSECSFFRFPDFITINKLILKRYIFKNSYINRFKTYFFKILSINN